MKLPNGERAIVDTRKLLEYCLNSEHPRGRNKARVFLRLESARRMRNLSGQPFSQQLGEPALNPASPVFMDSATGPGVYEVEFADDSGKTYAMVALRAEQLMRLHHEPVHQAA